MKIRTGIKAGKVIGDVAEWFTQSTGLDKLSEKYTQKTGRDCGCNKRHQILNLLFPF